MFTEEQLDYDINQLASIIEQRTDIQNQYIGQINNQINELTQSQIINANLLSNPIQSEDVLSVIRDESLNNIDTIARLQEKIELANGDISISREVANIAIELHPYINETGENMDIRTLVVLVIII